MSRRAQGKADAAEKKRKLEDEARAAKGTKLPDPEESGESSDDSDSNGGPPRLSPLHMLLEHNFPDHKCQEDSAARS